MRKRFKLPLMAVGLLICTCILIGICYLFYDRFIDDAIVLVDGNLSINYINGNKFDQKHNTELKFSVTNNGAESIYYFIYFKNVNGSGEYTLKSNDNAINISNTLNNSTISSYIKIDGNSSQNYVMNIDGDAYSGNINVQREALNYDTFGDIILKNNEIHDNPLTELGSSSKTNEGLITSMDDYGVSHYYRGKIDNNYVDFSGYVWRIVRINGDGTVKLILDDVLKDNYSYYETGYKMNEISIYNTLNNFYSKLSSSSNYISTINYCNDISQKDGSFSGYDRILIDKIYSLKCISDKVSMSVGLLTIDEFIYAGGSKDINKDFYLYNSDITNGYFLMSLATGNSENYNPFIINSDGSINTNIKGTDKKSVRPVISIIKNVSASGNGTIENPYVIEPLVSD